MMFRAGAFLRVYGGDQGQVHSTGMEYKLYHYTRIQNMKLSEVYTIHSILYYN